MINRRNFLAISCITPFLIEDKISFKDNILIVSVLRVDHVNQNKRIYPRTVVEKAISSHHSRSRCKLAGELFEKEGRSQTLVSLDKVSHKVNKFYLQDDYLMAEIEFLNTKNGKALKSLIENNADIKFRSSGIGSLKLRSDGFYEVSSYKLLGIDAMPGHMACSFS